VAGVGEALAADVTAVRDRVAPEAPDVDWTAETLHLSRRQPTDEHLVAARDRLDARSGTEDDRALWAAHEVIRFADGPETHDVEVWAGRVGTTGIVALPARCSTSTTSR